jgi:hypothetical protein
MATIGEDIRAHLIGSTVMAGPLPNYLQRHVIEQNTMAETPPSKRIWYRRAGQNDDLAMSKESGVVTSEWDLEIFAPNDTDVCAIADVVKTRLDGLQGTMGGRSVMGAFVDDHDDDYLPRGVADETEAINMAALRITIFTTSAT